MVDPLTGLSQLKLGLSKPVETEIIPLKKHVISSDHAWKHGSRAHEAWLKKNTAYLVPNLQRWLSQGTVGNIWEVSESLYNIRNDGYCITSGEHDDTPGFINPSALFSDKSTFSQLEHLSKAKAKVGFFGPTTQTLDILGRCATDALICQCIEIFYGYVFFNPKHSCWG